MKQNIFLFEQPEVITGDIKRSQNSRFSLGELIRVFSNLIQLIIDQFCNFIHLRRIFITPQQVFIVKDPDSNWIFHISEISKHLTKTTLAGNLFHFLKKGHNFLFGIISTGT